MMREDSTEAATRLGSFSESWSPQLLRSFLFALGILLIVRFGHWIPLPGLDIDALSEYVNRPGVAPYGWIYTADILSQVNIFALGLWPFVYAWAATELFCGGTPSHIRAAYRRWLTLLIAVCLAVHMASGFSSITIAGYWGLWTTINLVREPGPLFWVVAVMTLTAGTMLLLWLGEQITKTRLCDGIWLIVAVDIIAKIPVGVIWAWQMYQTGVFSSSGLVLLAGVLVTATILIVVMERARRCIPTGSQIDGGAERETTFRLRLDYVTIVPPVLAAMFLAVAVSGIQYLHAHLGDQVLILIAFLAEGQPLYLLIYAFLILALTMILIIRVASPRVLVALLSESERMMAGRAQLETQKHVEFILSRLMLVTAAYLLIISFLPALLVWFAKMPIHFDGISIMIVVIVMLDIQERAKARQLSDR